MSSTRKIHRLFPHLFIALITIALLSGCASLGKDFDHDSINQLTVDQTRKSDVLKMLGEPWRTGKENGLDAWTYGYYKYGVFRDEFAKDLVLKFDAQGILRSYSFNTTEIDL